MKHPTEPSDTRSRFALLRDSAGAVYVEYVTLLVVVSLVMGAGIAALGLPMLRTFRFAQYVLGAPLP